MNNRFNDISSSFLLISKEEKEEEEEEKGQNDFESHFKFFIWPFEEANFQTFGANPTNLNSN